MCLIGSLPRFRTEELQLVLESLSNLTDLFIYKLDSGLWGRVMMFDKFNCVNTEISTLFPPSFLLPGRGWVSVDRGN